MPAPSHPTVATVRDDAPRTGDRPDTSDPERHHRHSNGDQAHIDAGQHRREQSSAPPAPTLGHPGDASPDRRHAPGIADACSAPKLGHFPRRLARGRDRVAHAVVIATQRHALRARTPPALDQAR